MHIIDRRFLAFLGCLLFATTVVADEAKSPKGQRIFYTGHSFHMFVPQYIEQFVKAAKIEGHQSLGKQGIGGSRVWQHWDLPDERNKAKKALNTGDVDVFTMAAHLTIPDRGIMNFTELGLKHNPKLRLLVQGSWFPFDTFAPGKRIRKNADRDKITIEDLRKAITPWQKKLEAHVDELNEKHGRKAVFLVPAGDAVIKLRGLVIEGKYPGVKTQSELFRDAIGHGGAHVQAVVAYCNYATIYRTSPVGLKVQPRGVSEEQNAILQKLAWDSVSQYPRAGVVPAKESVKEGSKEE